MKLELAPFHIKELYRNNYTLDMVFILKMVEDNMEVEEFCEENEKLRALYNTIVRKGLLSSGKLTLEGKSVMDLLSKETEEKHIKKKIKDESFEAWWSKFPGTDSFEYNNRKFTGTRALRVKKEDCKTKIKSILSEGEYTLEDLIGALELEVQQKRENSYKTGQNKMSYMQNSLTYLNQRTWEPFVELYRKNGSKISESKLSTGVDI